MWGCGGRHGWGGGRDRFPAGEVHSSIAPGETSGGVSKSWRGEGDSVSEEGEGRVERGGEKVGGRARKRERNRVSG